VSFLANAWTQYQNPRFCVDHLLRDEGVGSLSGWTAATGYPLDRMLDQQQQLVSRANAAAATTLKWTRAIHPTVTHRIPVDRVVVLGSNFHGNYVRVHIEDSLDDASYAAVAQADPSAAPEDAVSWGDAVYHCAPPDMIDWHLYYAGGAPNYRYLKLFIEAGTAGYTAPEISELWLTRTLQPYAGPAHQWTNGVIPNVSSSETRSGYVTTTKHGAERARYSLAWDHLPVGQPPGVTNRRSDLELLRYVHRKAGIRENTLLYQHPDTGGPTVIDDFVSASGASTVNCGLTVQSSVGPGGKDVVRCTASAAGACSFYRTGEPTVDLRDSILEVWVRAPLASMPDFKASLKISLLSGASPYVGSTTYNLGDVVDVEELDDEWYRIAWDPETWTDTTFITGNDRPADLSQVTSVVYHWISSASLYYIEWAKMIQRPKRTRPVVCHLTEYTETQTGRMPAGVLLYDVQMQLEEVLT